MSTQPSIKGSIVAGHAEVLVKYLADAGIDEQILSTRFEPGELDMLMGPIDATAWYDIRMYRRLLEFLRDYPGDGSTEYLIQAGRRSAENMIRAGIYQQFEYLGRTQHHELADAAQRSAAFGRDLRLLTTLSRSIINFAESSVIEDAEHPLRWTIQYAAAGDYPEVMCWSTQGLCNRMAEEHDASDLWFWERPSADVLHFRMSRDI